LVEERSYGSGSERVEGRWKQSGAGMVSDEKENINVEQRFKVDQLS
jgi:hypothetical protein